MRYLMAQMFFLRYPEGRERAVTLSYDDGLPADRRLVSSQSSDRDILHKLIVSLTG